MTPWARVLFIAAGGGLLGAVALSLLTLGGWAIFAREALNDGQFGMVFLLTVPFGALLGGVAGAAVALLGLGKLESAGRLSLAGGGLIAVLVLLLTLFWLLGSGSPQGRGLKGYLLALIHPGYGAPFLWAVALIAWGMALLKRQS
jgi:hypothetical protein